MEQVASITPPHPSTEGPVSKTFFLVFGILEDEQSPKTQ
jgi:hypothetical protein